MATQNAIAITAIGSHMEKIQVPIREPKDNEILIKMTATAIAPFDQALRDYGAADIGNRLPAVVSFDLIGTVSKHSPTISPSYATKFPIGTRVFAGPAAAFHPLSGGAQEYSIINAPWAAIIPPNITDAQACAFPINAFSGFASLFSNEGPNQGLGIPFPGSKGSEGFRYQDVKFVVNGAGSRVGELAVQFAKIAGFGTIACVSGTSSHEELKKLGATHVFDRKLDQDTLVKEVKAALAGSDKAYVLDTRTLSEFSFALAVLEDVKEGYLCRLLGDAPVDLKGKEHIHENRFFGMCEMHPVTSELFWSKIGGWVADGLYGGPFVESEGLDVGSVNETLDGYKSGRSDRKVIHIS